MSVMEVAVEFLAVVEIPVVTEPSNIILRLHLNSSLVHQTDLMATSDSHSLEAA